MSWYVRNVRDAKWWDYGPARFASLSSSTTTIAQIGVNLFVLEPGQPMSMYHWEADQEGFLVLSGEALLIVDDEERPLRQWDYFHCPPRVPHTIVGAGTGPCRDPRRRGEGKCRGRLGRLSVLGGRHAAQRIAPRRRRRTRRSRTPASQSGSTASFRRAGCRRRTGCRTALVTTCYLLSEAWSGWGQRPAPSSAGSSSSSSPKTSSSAATACGRTSSTVTGAPELARDRREHRVLEAAGRDPVGERRRVEVDVERIAVRCHPA